MKPKQKNNKLIILVSIILLILIIIIVAILVKNTANSPGNKNITLSDNTATRIIDGDTFELASGEVVRLICIDTPETGKKGATEATEFLSTLILAKELRLESDRDNTDAYGRLLRYVYVNSTEGEIFVNQAIVQQGYGQVFRYGNDTSKCGEIENANRNT